MVLYAIGLIVLIFIIGFLALAKKLDNLVNQHAFVNDFRNKFIEFATSQLMNSTHNPELYVWLTKNASFIQKFIGPEGVLDLYVAPYGRYQARDYHIILNTLPKFRDGSITHIDANFVDDCLLRYLGATEVNLSTKRKGMKNPILWFQSGIKEIFSIPIILLLWFGIINEKKVRMIKSNILFSVTTGLIGLVTFLGSLVTIIQGKEQTIAFFHWIFK